MKIGDVVTVKDALGYNTYMQELVGHIGVILVVGDEYAQVHILGRNRPIEIRDLEVVKKCP